VQQSHDLQLGRSIGGREDGAEERKKEYKGVPNVGLWNANFQ
jgi:hypothetical protein